MITLAYIWALSFACFIELVYRAPFLDEDSDTPTPARKTALLLSGPLRVGTAFRYLLTAFGALALPLCIASGFLPSTSVWFGAGMILGGEIAERFLFFRAVVAPKKPGVPTS